MCSHRLEEFGEIKWKPAKLSKIGSSQVASRQHRRDLRRAEYRGIRKVSKMKQKRSYLYLQNNILSSGLSKQVSEIPTLQNLSILVGKKKPVRTDDREQNSPIRRF